MLMFLKKLIQMIDVFNFFVVADRRYMRDSVVYGVFFNLGEAENFRNALHSTSKIFKCNKDNIKVNDDGIKIYTGNLFPVC